MFPHICTTELILIFVVIIFLFGGKKLPELGKGIGDAINELKKALKNKD